MRLWAQGAEAGQAAPMPSCRLPEAQAVAGKLAAARPLWKERAEPERVPSAGGLPDRPAAEQAC